MKRTAILNTVGLTSSVLRKMPRLQQHVQQSCLTRIRPALPAVTCTAQATYLTGLTPGKHGIVGNGWYDRSLAEVHFWKQSNHLVRGRKLWEELREHEPTFSCAKLFWWYNMYSTADYSITPRPMYPADGRKIFDIYTAPASMRPEIKKELGEFPFPSFWGPAAGIRSSQWIAEAAKWIEEKYKPGLNLVYLPHLDYNLQRLGTTPPALDTDFRQVEELVMDLLAFFDGRGVQSVILSEYGITDVERPIHLNRLFRERGWVAIKDELGLEMIDCGASRVFGVADHQVAHIYVHDPGLHAEVRSFLEGVPGVESVLDKNEQEASGIAHPRSGDFLAVADESSWFTYYYWFDDKVAPDFARTVDIHRKIGYDPVELFVDPELRSPKAKVALFLLKKKLGIRGLLSVIPLNAALVKGSHGRIPASQDDWPILVTPPQFATSREQLKASEVYDVLKQVCMGREHGR